MTYTHLEEEFKESIRRRYDTYMTEAIGYLGDTVGVLNEIPQEFRRQDILQLIISMQKTLELVSKMDIFKRGVDEL